MINSSQSQAETNQNLNKYMKLKHGEARVFNAIGILSNNYLEVHPSQATVGEIAGKYCRPWTNKLLNGLGKKGCLVLTKRGKIKGSYKNHTDIIAIPDELYLWEPRQILATKFPAFAIFTPAVRMRIQSHFKKNLTQLSSSYINIYNSCYINIKGLENGAPEKRQEILNKHFSKKRNFETEKQGASINNFVSCDTPYKEELNESDLKWLRSSTIKPPSCSAPPPLHKYKPNKDRVFGTKKVTKHFNAYFHFRRSEEEYERERREYLEDIGYKSKLDNPLYNPMIEVRKLNAVIYERVRIDYEARYPHKIQEPEYLDLDQDQATLLAGFIPVSEEERKAFRAELIRNLTR